VAQTGDAQAGRSRSGKVGAHGNNLTTRGGTFTGVGHYFSQISADYWLVSPLKPAPAEAT
jgi:hypothetical protein